MAKGAQNIGVQIHRRTQADGFEWTGSEWLVRGVFMEEKGGNLLAQEGFEIRAEHVITATGNHAQRTANFSESKSPPCQCNTSIL